mgnify:CR=1 FL=1
MEDKFFNASIYDAQAQKYAQSCKSDHMQYLPDMEIIDSDLLEQVTAARNKCQWGIIQLKMYSEH